MIKLLFTFLLLFSLPALADKATFEAKISDTQVTAGEPFTLELVLTGARAKEAPNLSGINQHFAIVGQSEIQNYSWVNGQSSATQGVELSLVAREAGHFTIAGISLETSEGVLSTEPLEIDVQRGAAPAVAGGGQAPRAAGAAAGGSGESPIAITATVDNTTPYQDQPVRYQILVTIFGDVTDLSLEDIAVDNAVFNKPTKPKVFDVEQSGRPAKLLEYDFVLTAVKPGKLVVPAPSFHGTALGQVRMPDPANQGFAAIFNMMRSMGSHPFTIAGPAVELNVKAPAQDMHPWLPLYSLKIQDEWRNVKDAKVGEPVTRTLTLYANGMDGSQLPDLEAYENHEDFKVYKDKPNVGTDEGKPGTPIAGWRRESYTLIPQKAGTLILPAIHIAFWDLTKNSVGYADIPSKSLVVAENATAQKPAQSQRATLLQPPSIAPSQPMAADLGGTAPAALVEKFPTQYVVIAVLAAALLLTFLWVARLSTKLNALKNGPVPKTTSSKKAAPPILQSPDDLKAVATADGLKAYLQKLAAQRWKIPANSSLDKILATAPSSLKRDLAQIITPLKDALYAGRSIDLAHLKEKTTQLPIEKEGKSTGVQKSEKLADLNPR